MRNTASRLGFIKDSEGTYRKGNFIFKDGKIMRESSIVPEGTIEDLKDDYVTLDECIRAVLAFPASIGEEPRTTNVYIDKSGKGFKVAKKLGKNTVAVVMSNRQVMDLKPRDIPEQTDTKVLENKDKEDKPQKPKAIKSFAKPKELDKIKESQKRIKLVESDATPEFLNDLKNLLNTHCRVDISEMRFKDGNSDVVEIVFPNGYSKTAGIGADSNLAAIRDIVKVLY